MEVVHHSSVLLEIVIMLGVAVGVVAVFKRLNLSPVLGYLIVGGIIGPYGFKIISNVESTKYLAEFGVVFLLFMIGLELTLDRLVSMRKNVFGFGTLQVLLCALIMGGITYSLSGDFNISFVAGFVFALSSTAVILQVLTERGEEVTQYGRLSIATLILQDLAFVPLLIMIPLLADKDADIFYTVGSALFQAIIVLLAIVVIGKRFLRPIYKLIAQTGSQELFIALTLLIILGTSWLTETNGLSLALGAFVAGLLIAETEYRNQVDTDLRPFKGLLMGLFFISIGMSIDFNFMMQNIVTISLLTVTVITVKTTMIYFLARLFGFGRGCSIKAGFTLSQVGEFAFVLFTLAAANKILPENLSQIFIVVVSFSMAITPLLTHLGNLIAKKIDFKNPVHLETVDIKNETSDLANHVIVVGFEKVGRATCDLLKYTNTNYVILDEDPKNVHQGRREGFPVFFGKCNIVDNLEMLGVERAKMVAITLNDMKESVSLIKSIRKKYPKLRVVAKAQDRKTAKKLQRIGATITIAEAFESSLMIGNFILTSIGLSDSQVEDAIDSFRKKEHPESQLKGVLYKAKEDISVI